MTLKRIVSQQEAKALTEKLAAKAWKKIKDDHAKYLADKKVHLPKPQSLKAHQLTILGAFVGRPIHKDIITQFVQIKNQSASGDQQVRHLKRNGWWVLGKDDQTPDGDQIPSRHHLLFDTSKPHPDFLTTRGKRQNMNTKDFEEIKRNYQNRCATCGSKENEPHLQQSTEITKLQKGHMDPHKPLDVDNIIPQCQICNRAYLNDFVFDDRGRAHAVASTRPVIRASQKVKEKVQQALEKERERKSKKRT